MLGTKSYKSISWSSPRKKSTMASLDYQARYFANPFADESSAGPSAGASSSPSVPSSGAQRNLSAPSEARLDEQIYRLASICLQRIHEKTGYTHPSDCTIYTGDAGIAFAFLKAATVLPDFFRKEEGLAVKNLLQRRTQEENEAKSSTGAVGDTMEAVSTSPTSTSPHSQGSDSFLRRIQQRSADHLEIANHYANRSLRLVLGLMSNREGVLAELRTDEEVPGGTAGRSTPGESGVIQHRNYRRPSHEGAYLAGPAGAFVSSAVVLYRSGKYEQAQRCVHRYMRLIQSCLEYGFEGVFEVLYGAAGLLLGLVFLEKHIEMDNLGIRVAEIQRAKRKLAKVILGAGRRERARSEGTNNLNNFDSSSSRKASTDFERNRCGRSPQSTNAKECTTIPVSTNVVDEDAEDDGGYISDDEDDENQRLHWHKIARAATRKGRNTASSQPKKQRVGGSHVEPDEPSLSGGSGDDSQRSNLGGHWSTTLPSQPPLEFAWHGKEYVGAGHGYSGILHALLNSWEVLDRDDQDAAVATLNWLVSLQLKTGNFPSSLPVESESRAGRLVHWCHGAPGVILMLCKAYEILGEARYLNVAEKAADVVWSKGLLNKGWGICHGAPGNGYSFLALYRATKTEKYLDRARKFASWLLSDNGQYIIENADRPWSLYEGMAGAVCFLLDVLQPATSGFPLYEP